MALILVLFLPFFPSLVSTNAALKEGVTDSGLHALASAGCGEKLTSLTLFGVFGCDWWGAGMLDVCAHETHISPHFFRSHRDAGRSDGLRSSCARLCWPRRKLGVPESWRSVFSWFFLACGCFSIDPLLSTGMRSITGNNFAAALGLPVSFHRESPQTIQRQWQLRRAQFLFLKEEPNKDKAVRLWDEEHKFPPPLSARGLPSLSFCPATKAFFLCGAYFHSKEDEKLSPVVFTWSPLGHEVEKWRFIPVCFPLHPL